MRRPLRHPRDPKGYVAVRTDLQHGDSCSKCAYSRVPGNQCHLVPCLSFMRKDGADIHYVKAKK